MSVGHERAHARHAEIEVGQIVPQLAHERQDEAAERAVDVQVQLVLKRQLGELGHGVQLAEVALGGGADQRHGVGRDGLL